MKTGREDDLEPADDAGYPSDKESLELEDPGLREEVRKWRAVTVWRGRPLRSRPAASQRPRGTRARPSLSCRASIQDHMLQLVNPDRNYSYVKRRVSVGDFSKVPKLL